MGLFSNLRKASLQPTGQEDIARGVLTMPILVAASDGDISQPETEQIGNMCMFSPVFHAVGAKRTQELGLEIVNDLKTKGATEVFQRAAASLSPNLRETAMCFAIRTALADGVLEDGEKKMLVTMGESMGIAEETFFNIFNVMVMMQRAPGS